MKRKGTKKWEPSLGVKSKTEKEGGINITKDIKMPLGNLIFDKVTANKYKAHEHI